MQFAGERWKVLVQFCNLQRFNLKLRCVFLRWKSEKACLPENLLLKAWSITATWLKLVHVTRDSDKKHKFCSSFGVDKKNPLKVIELCSQIDFQRSRAQKCVKNRFLCCNNLCRWFLFAVFCWQRYSTVIIYVLVTRYLWWDPLG